MHFIYYINRLTATKVDSTYLGCLTSLTAYMSVAGLEHMTTGSAVSALSYRATQVDNVPKTVIVCKIDSSMFSHGIYSSMSSA